MYVFFTPKNIHFYRRNIKTNKSSCSGLAVVLQVSIQVYKYTSIQVYKYTLYKYTGIHVYNYTSIQVYGNIINISNVA